MSSVVVVAPVRSADQRLAALKRANAIRSARARMKEQLVDGAVDVLDLLAKPPSWLVSMRVYALLVSLPKWGPTKARRMLCECRVSDSKTIGGLSDRQRREISNVLRKRFGG